MKIFKRILKKILCKLVSLFFFDSINSFYILSIKEPIAGICVYDIKYFLINKQIIKKIELKLELKNNEIIDSKCRFVEKQRENKTI